jgi:uncharacterized small protein (DUF1192 family)
MKILLVVISLISINAFAEDDMLAKEKTNIGQNIDKRIAILQEEKSCMSSVISKEDFKKCRDKSHSAHKLLDEENKLKRAKHLDDQIKKFQSEKEKLNSEIKK